MKKKKITSKIQFLWEDKEQAQNECNTPPKYTYKLPETIGNEIHCVDNLDFLKLNQERLKGKVKCIYIDPPYNTGNDFIYKDKRHSKGECKHSKWLAFMLPRLKLARDLLREDGVIFISIDDNEQANLRLLMNEVFGEGEFVASFIWHKKLTGGYDNKFINTQHEYLFCYAKDIESLGLNLEEKETKYTLEDENGKKFKWDSLWNIGGLTYSKSLDYAIIAPDGTEIWPVGERGVSFWLWSKEKVDKERSNLQFKKNKDGEWRVYKKIYASDGVIYGSVLEKEKVKGNTNASAEIKSLFGGDKIFDYPKPTQLIKHLLQISTAPNDLILDFFAGSGTTGQAVMELNHENPEKAPRNFILVQWNEEIKEGKEAHKFCVENGLEPVISSITVERLRRAGAKYKGVDVGFEVFDY